jgi:hypothetical protein
MKTLLFAVLAVLLIATPALAWGDRDHAQTFGIQAQGTVVANGAAGLVCGFGKATSGGGYEQKQLMVAGHSVQVQVQSGSAGGSATFMGNGKGVVGSVSIQAAGQAQGTKSGFGRR